ncbi:hypothetical protein FAM22280_00588 [Lacticaseibacillus paracasei]|uniref:hypothetical protein n=1 Tax=Lacticaseibacillus paracasei TaxID=1597 RepID=UPI000FF5ACC3|nr:hypothetical protein [Lacticaseibacillus paracasei]RNE12476.1 hypothetical protein FAM22280_00588 [Lacticaseibacillus paracasei]
MSNETKRDVFERALYEWYDLIFKVGGQGEEAYGYCEFDGTISKYEKDYDAALPDDLPVIPKEIGEYIERQKQGSTLRSAIIAATDFNAVDDEEADWIFYHSETFALAWLLGVWRVEETGEIVKLEAEK